ncbi:MAG: deoxyribonuclease IV [bacterium]|nr:deoxyribonuclease IV [bacterium]
MTNIETLIGAHVSISGGLHQALERGEKIGCNAVQIFTKNQVQWQAKPLSIDEVDRYFQSLKKSPIVSVVAHNSYLINLGSPDHLGREKSRRAFLEEIDRAELLKIPFLIFHPGSHKGAGEALGLRLIAESLNFIQQQRPNHQVKLLLETTSGQGSNLGYSFNQLKSIIDMVEESWRIGVCLDTCHIFAAGYDIRTRSTYEATMEQFDRVIGLDRLGAIHLNDSQKELGSRIDRHERIGNGQIGLDGFRFMMNDTRLKKIPKILEIPGDLQIFKLNLDLLKSLIEA